MRKSIITSVFLLLLLNVFAQNAVKLEYKFSIGDSLNWTQNTKQTVKQVLNGTEQIVNSEISGSLKLRVHSTTPSGARIEIQYKKITLISKGFMGEMKMDSDGPQDNLYHKLMKSMVGKKFYINLSKQGVVENVEGVEILWSEFSTIGMDETTQAAMQQSMERSFGKESFKGSIETALTYYPSMPVDVGATWQNETSMAMNFPLQIQNHWKLNGLSTTSADIECNSSIVTLDREREILLPGGITSKFNLDGSQAAKGTMNLSDGWPNIFTVTSDVKGTMTVLAGGMIANDMQIPMEIHSESTYHITKL
jgi:Family of unknown function (DUF6263)